MDLIPRLEASLYQPSGPCHGQLASVFSDATNAQFRKSNHNRAVKSQDEVDTTPLTNSTLANWKISPLFSRQQVTSPSSFHSSTRTNRQGQSSSTCEILYLRATQAANYYPLRLVIEKRYNVSCWSEHASDCQMIFQLSRSQSEHQQQSSIYSLLFARISSTSASAASTICSAAY